MGKIAGHSIKDKPAKGLSFLLKYSDFEYCFTDRTTEDVFIYARFTHRQSLWKKDRDRLSTEGKFDIGGCSYSTFIPGYIKPHLEAMKNPILVEADIVSIPFEIVVEAKLNRSLVRDILCEKIGKYTQKGFTSAGWYTRLALLTKSPELECTHGYYGVAWQGTPTIETIPLHTK